jgi:hypothetical protein
MPFKIPISDAASAAETRLVRREPGATQVAASTLGSIAASPR